MDKHGDICKTRLLTIATAVPPFTHYWAFFLCIFAYTIRLCMSEAKDIQNFFYSQYFSDGLRLTFGTIVPALVFSAFGSLQTGIIVSLGAMAVGLSGTPGSLHHRRNGMFISTLSVLVSTLLTNLADGIPGLSVVILMALSFLFSMFAVYGTRASFVGTLGILIMVLSISAMDDPTL